MTAVKAGYPLTSITWPYRGLRCRPIEVEYLFEVIRWQVTSFQMIAGSSLIFLKFIWNMLCLCAAQLKFWFQTDLGRENSVSCYRQGRQLLLTFLTMFTLTAEADRVLCQLVMFLTAFFHWMNKMKYSCDQKSSVSQGWFVYWVFGWEMRRLSKSEIRFRMNSECCNADFWQVRRIGLSWNFKMLQWINPNESFRPYYIHYEHYVKRF